ncbi:cytochrome c [Agriterribacter sp.]|uniref:c-type cytochrome n=1 Tax=Agriterribacter sp. TaxID=2821509 RepID=UPI002C49E74B|nr:cytochrome c [Agriterribacter sp.]HTN07330.1 cytochrome c [Agriterribacter sp.]
MRRRLIPVNVVIAALVFVLLSLDPDQSKPPPVVMERGKAVYAKECLSCHQQDGLGVQGMNPPLAKTAWVLGPKRELIKIVLNGLTEPIEIEGDTFHNPMPPHPHLTDQQIADVLSYVRNSFGNKASAVTAREVKKVRAEKKI